MIIESEEFAILQNAINRPVAGLTAVEVDTSARGRELTEILRETISKRPHFQLLLSNKKNEAALLLKQASEVTAKWPSQEGVLFIIDNNDDKEIPHQFWVDMNALRESWGAVNCHIIFFILKHNYRLLLQTADHFADWIQLNLHITGAEAPDDRADSSQDVATVFHQNGFSPYAAREQLSILEKQLAIAIQKEEQPKRLVNQYYLPMLEAAVIAADLNRANILKEKIKPEYITPNRKSRWFKMNSRLDIELGDFLGAKKWAQKLGDWCEQHGDDRAKADVFNALGNIALGLNELDNAENHFNRAIQISKSFNLKDSMQIGYLHLGKVSFARDDYEKAADLYNEALKIRDGNEDTLFEAIVFFHFGKVEIKKRNFDAAKKWFERSLNITESLNDYLNSALACQQLGNIASERLEYDLAKTWYQKAINYAERLGIHKLLMPLYRNLGDNASKLLAFDDAVMWYSRLIQIDAESVSAYDARGHIYLSQNKQMEALEDFSKSIELEPNNVEAYKNRGNIHLKLSDHEKALADFNTAISLEPNHCDSYLHRGKVYSLLDKHAKALADFNTAISLQPDYLESYFYRGKTYSLMNEWGKALADYKKFLASVSSNPKYRVEAAETLGWLGDSRDLKAFVNIEGGKYELENFGHVGLKPFEIGKYPVTNRCFEEFIKAGGYVNKDYWSPECRKWLDYTKALQPAFWDDRKWKCPNSPVVGISWYEADAFTRWLTLDRNDGYEYKLPSENQWQAAAAGFEKREYPWGDEWDNNRCNSEELKIKKITPVGIFRAGDTPEGVADLSGNMWEWTLSDYHTQSRMEDFRFDENLCRLLAKGDYKKSLSIIDEIKYRPVLRGGSWKFGASYCRCRVRSHLNPFSRDNGVGFRCVRF